MKIGFGLNNFSEIKKLHKDSYDIRRDAFALVLSLMLLGSLAAAIISIFVDIFAEPVIFRTLIITVIFSVSVALIYIKTGKYQILSLMTVIFMDAYLVPTFIARGVSSRGIVPIWFAAGAVAIFFVLDLKKFLWSIPIILFVDFYFFSESYIWSNPPEIEESSFTFMLSILITFILCCVALFLVVILQEKSIRSEKKQIEISKEHENNAGMAKSRFLANMSHEIRTPMNSIIGLSELMLKDDMEEKTRQEVRILKDSAYDLLQIIDDVLMFSKLDSGKMTLNKTDFDLSKLIKRIIGSVSAQIQAKNLKMRVKIDNDIPKIINGDDQLIQQALTRLIFISLQLTDNGRIILNLKGDRNENGKIYITGEIADTGEGLSKIDLDAIYGAYDTYDSRQNSNLKGIGLKFSICNELFKMMNGDLQIESIEGVGLKSIFRFECDIVDDSPMISLVEEKKRKVLIYVRDNRELETWKNIMENFKIRPDYVNSYFSFDKAVQNKKYDYIFLPEEQYSSVSNVLTMYRIEQETYIICGIGRAYGDFDKCRIIRHPVSGLIVSDVLNDRWDPQDYSSSDEEGTIDASSARILVVDDNGVNLKVAIGIFKHYMIDIDVAKSGEEALRKMERTKYHMVLMDMVMPDMSGEETLRHIIASDNDNMKDVPVIALTANVGVGLREEILSMGFQEYLAKPIKQRYLLKILNDFLPPGIIKIVKSEPNKASEKEDLTKKENVLVTSKGLSNIGFNEASYNAILNTYYSEGMRKIKGLPDLLEAGNISLFTTDVHGIKSSSASIGAMTVSEMFKELEFAGKENNTDYIRDKYDVYVAAFKKILSDVKDYLISQNAFTYKEEVEHDLSCIEAEELSLESLKEFKKNITGMNLKACDAFFEEIEGRNFGNEMNGKLQDIKKAYDMFDFHTVKGKLNEMNIE